jgi:hypothetical protein
MPNFVKTNSNSFYEFQTLEKYMLNCSRMSDTKDEDLMYAKFLRMGPTSFLSLHANLSILGSYFHPPLHCTGPLPPAQEKAENTT